MEDDVRCQGGSGTSQGKGHWHGLGDTMRLKRAGCSIGVVSNIGAGWDGRDRRLSPAEWAGI